VAIDSNIELLISEGISRRLTPTRTKADRIRSFGDLIRSNPTLSHYCTWDAGIAGGLYAVVDLDRDFYRTLQSTALQRSTEHSGEEPLPIIDFPKLPLSDPVTGATVLPNHVDQMFFMFRQERSLRYSAPESFNHTNHLGRTWRAKDDEGRELGELVPDLIVYVPRAEMGAYLFVWRVALRLIQRGRLMRTIGEPFTQQSLVSKEAVNVFKPSVWAEVANLTYDLPCARMATKLAQLESPHAPDEMAGFQDIFRDWVTNIDSSTGGLAADIECDLKRLKLVDPNGQTTSGFWEIVEYLMRTVSEHEFHDLKSCLDACSGTRPAFEKILHSGLLGRVLEAAIAFVMRSNDRNVVPLEELPLVDLLAALHGGARFLVIPYFYQCVFAGTLVEHTIFGVWRSLSYPYEIQRKPSWSRVHAIASLHNKPDTETVPELAVRLRRVRDFFKALSEPVVDAAFYGSVISAAEYKRGALDSKQLLGHKVKRVASALTDPWVIPASSILNIEIAAPEETFGQQIGTLRLRSDMGPIADKLGLAIQRDVLTVLQQALRLWSLIPAPRDLPFIPHPRGQSTIEFSDFLNGCLKFSQLALVPFALAYKSVRNAKDLEAFLQLRTRVDALLSRQVVLVDPVESYPLRIGITSENGADTTWLYRVFAAVFQNCVQHGDLLQPIRVGVKQMEGGRLQFEIRNTARPRGDGSLSDQLMTHYRDSLIDHPNDSEIQELVRVLVAIRSSVSFSFASSEYDIHTSDVIRICLAELEGALTSAPPHDGLVGEVATEFVCKYQLRGIAAATTPKSE
jgi:hypothetical protein